MPLFWLYGPIAPGKNYAPGYLLLYDKALLLYIRAREARQREEAEVKITKKIGKQASDIYTKWLNDGVPQDVTKYEAFNLTKGLVGDPYGQNHSYQPIRLIEVAVRYAKKGGK